MTVVPASSVDSVEIEDITKRSVLCTNDRTTLRFCMVERAFLSVKWSAASVDGY